MISRACYHRRTAKVMLSSLLVCNLVCRLVCLSVSNITEKRMNRFSRKFQDMLAKMQGTIWTIFFFFFFLGGGGGGGGLTPCIQGLFFYIFARKFVSVRYITEKTDLGGVRIWNKEQSEFFGMFRLTPWIRERFFHFRDPCFLVLLWENEWMDLHEFSIICQARHEKWSSRLCHASLHCFTVSRLGTTACLWAILRLNEIIDFHGIFMIGLLRHEEQSGTVWDQWCV